MEVEVEVASALNPENKTLGVLLQLPYGFVVLKPDDARQVAEMLWLTAQEVEQVR